MERLETFVTRSYFSPLLPESYLADRDSRLRFATGERREDVAVLLRLARRDSQNQTIIAAKEAPVVIANSHRFSSGKTNVIANVFTSDGYMVGNVVFEVDDQGLVNLPEREGYLFLSEGIDADRPDTIEAKEESRAIGATAVALLDKPN